MSICTKSAGMSYLCVKLGMVSLKSTCYGYLMLKDQVRIEIFRHLFKCFLLAIQTVVMDYTLSQIWFACSYETALPPSRISVQMWSLFFSNWLSIEQDDGRGRGGGLVEGGKKVCHVMYRVTWNVSINPHRDWIPWLMTLECRFSFNRTLL